jgi:ataxia telangiectasia mutated family protein
VSVQGSTQLYVLSMELTESRFSNLEMMMSTRISLLHSMRKRETSGNLGILCTPLTTLLVDAEIRCLKTLSEAARASGNPQIGINYVTRMQALKAAPSYDVSVEFASSLWAQKEQKLAVDTLKELYTRSEKSAKNGRQELRLAHMLSNLVSTLHSYNFQCFDSFLGHLDVGGQAREAS